MGAGNTPTIIIRNILLKTRLRAMTHNLHTESPDPADVDAGIRAYQEGDYHTAYQTWLPLAECGNAQAQHGLGKLYEFGLGVERDFAQATKWYRSAGYQGVNDAQASLGRMYAEGQGISQNFAKATKWFRKAARASDTTAEAALGVMNRRQLGITHSGEAREWYRRNAQNDNAQAQYVLGLIYALGDGIPRDVPEAVKWLSKSAEQGHCKAQYYLALQYFSGKGTQKNYAHAFAWWSVAAANGDEESANRVDALQRILTPEQRTQADTLTSEYLKKFASLPTEQGQPS